MPLKRVCICYAIVSAIALLFWAYYVWLVLLLKYGLWLPPLASMFTVLAFLAVNGWIYLTASLPAIISGYLRGFRSPVTLGFCILPAGLLFGPLVAEPFLDAELARRLPADVVADPSAPGQDLAYVEIFHSGGKKYSRWSAKNLAEALLRNGDAEMVTTFPTDADGTWMAGHATTYFREGSVACAGVKCLPAKALRIRLLRGAPYRGLFYGISWSEVIEVSVAPPTRPGASRPPPADKVLYRQNLARFWLAQAPFRLVPGPVALPDNVDPIWRVPVRRLREDKPLHDNWIRTLAAMTQHLDPGRQKGVHRERLMEFEPLSQAFQVSTVAGMRRALERGRFDGYRHICTAPLKNLRAVKSDIEAHLEERTSGMIKIQCDQGAGRDKNIDLDDLDVDAATIRSKVPPPVQVIDCSRLLRDGKPACTGYLVLHWERAPPQHRKACQNRPRFWIPKRPVLEDLELLSLVEALHRAGSIAAARRWAKRIAPWHRRTEAVRTWLKSRGNLRPGFDARHCSTEL